MFTKLLNPKPPKNTSKNQTYTLSPTTALKLLQTCMDEIDIQQLGVYREVGSMERKDFFFYAIGHYLANSDTGAGPDYSLDRFNTKELISNIVARNCSPEERSVLISDIARDCIKYIRIPSHTKKLTSQFTKKCISETDKYNEIKWQEFFSLLLEPKFDPQLRSIVFNLLNISKSYIPEIARQRVKREKEEEKENKEHEDIQGASFIILSSLSKLLQIDPDPTKLAAATFQLKSMLTNFFKSEKEAALQLKELESLVKSTNQYSSEHEEEITQRLNSIDLQLPEQKPQANQYVYFPNEIEIPAETAQIVIKLCLDKLDCSKINLENLAGKKICESFIINLLNRYIDTNKKMSPDNKLEQMGHNDFSEWLDNFVLFEGENSPSTAHVTLLNIIKSTFYLVPRPYQITEKYEAYIGAKQVSSTEPNYEEFGRKFIAKIQPTKYDSTHDISEYKRLIIDVIFIGEKLLQANKALSTGIVSTYIAGILQPLFSGYAKNTKKIDQGKILIQIQSISKDLNDLYQKITTGCLNNPKGSFAELCNNQNEYTHCSPSYSSSSSFSSPSSSSSSSSSPNSSSMALP